MFVKILAALFFILTVTNAEDLDLKENYLKLNKEMIKNLSDQVKDKEILKMYKNDETSNRLQKLANQYNILNQAMQSFPNNAVSSEIDKMYKNKIAMLKDKDALTLTYFVSEHTPFIQIKRYTDEIDVLRSYYPNLNAKIFFNNYPKNYVNTLKAKVENIKLEKEVKKKGLFGSLNVDKQGNYIYEINKVKISTINKKLKDSFKILDKKGKSHIINIEIISNKKGQLKAVEEFSMRGIYRYALELQNYGVKSTNFKFHIHPWAFKKLSLKEVPAYLLSYCDNDDYRFKQCDNKYLMKGDVSLKYFFNEIEKLDKYYSKFNTSLLKGVKYD